MVCLILAMNFPLIYSTATHNCQCLFRKVYYLREFINWSRSLGYIVFYPSYLKYIRVY